jgi:hypothetical protein
VISATKVGDPNYIDVTSLPLNVTINAPASNNGGGGSSNNSSNYVTVTSVAQSAIDLKATQTSIPLGGTTSLVVGGGSGTGSFSFSTTTPKICSVSATGIVTGLTSGTCLVQVMKSASGIYLSATSSTISITVGGSGSQAGASAIDDAITAADQSEANRFATKAKSWQMPLITGPVIEVPTPKVAETNLITWKKSGTRYAIQIHVMSKYANELVTIQLGSKLNGRLVYKNVGKLFLTAKGDGVITQAKAPVKGTYYRVLLNSKVIYTQIVK